MRDCIRVPLPFIPGTARTKQNESGRQRHTHPREDNAHQIAHCKTVTVGPVGLSDPPTPESIPDNASEDHHVIEVSHGMSSQQVCNNPNASSRCTEQYNRSSFREYQRRILFTRMHSAITVTN